MKGFEPVLVVVSVRVGMGSTPCDNSPLRRRHASPYISYMRHFCEGNPSFPSMVGRPSFRPHARGKSGQIGPYRAMVWGVSTPAHS